MYSDDKTLNGYFNNSLSYFDVNDLISSPLDNRSEELGEVTVCRSVYAYSY